MAIHTLNIGTARIRFNLFHQPQIERVLIALPFTDFDAGNDAEDDGTVMNRDRHRQQKPADAEEESHDRRNARAKRVDERGELEIKGFAPCSSISGDSLRFICQTMSGATSAPTAGNASPASALMWHHIAHVRTLALGCTGV